MNKNNLIVLLGVAKAVRKQQEHNKMIIAEGLERGDTMEMICCGASHLKKNSAYQSISIHSAYHKSNIQDINQFYAIAYELEKQGYVTISAKGRYKKTKIRLTFAGMDYLKGLKRNCK
ncbi:hypothetical protein P4H82_27555 [Bacillus cereus]|nr:hypothetical protein [Bacillus cereus]MEB9190459.1 hypothetical protein [Bacillus cereus]